MMQETELQSAINLATTALGFGRPEEREQRRRPSFNSIRIRLASPDVIRSWSHGEVTKPETINYRSFKPEKDGLFCEKIFGPVKDWECNCGKYKRIRYRGVVCDRCGVEVTQAKVRRERLGHIQLAVPVSHIWFFKGVPSRIGHLLNMSIRDLERILYYESYVVIEPGNTGFKKREIISEDQYNEVMDEQPDSGLRSRMGAEAIRDLLAELDLEELSTELRAQAKMETSVQRKKELLKRLRIVEAFRHSGNRPEWMILETVPVLPPDLRPLVPLEGGRFATSDLNDLYRRVINRNNRLKKLMELRAPEVIVRNEKRMLQEAVDALFDNGRRGRVLRGVNNRPLKSLSGTLKGKQGRFRQNLLGKRVDYSGRSVIVVGPELKLHQCGLPKNMALELFKPFIIRKLEDRGFVQTVKSAKRLVERERPEVCDILGEIIQNHPVLLNRAPTLHRLGIHGFKPVLVEGKAIRIHPLVCAAFNADFDGDQMAVHVPLSFEAQLESRLLMISSNNILKPSDGRPVAEPSQDMVLGCHFLTKEPADFEASLKSAPRMGTMAELEMSLALKRLDYHGPVQWWHESTERWISTTAGPVIFNNDIAEAMVATMKKSKGGFNPVFMMFDSGSRGSRDQIRQLAGMRGLMAKPQKKLTGGIGEIIESPIKSNFREGLSVLEYFISTHGARKGLADTALTTADAGDLTRRLVDVAQDVTITEEDCGTILGLEMSALKEGEDIIEPLRERVVGCVALDEVMDPHELDEDSRPKVLVEAGKLILEETSQAIEDAGIETVKIRSVLTCEAKRGVCRMCYGRNLATMDMVDLGEAVGILAAQSIGEPGTQLTLRTFHIGGTAARIAEQTVRKTKVEGVIEHGDRLTFVNTPDGARVVTSYEGEVVLKAAAHGHGNTAASKLAVHSRFHVPLGATLMVDDGQKVAKDAVLFTWDPYTNPIMTDVAGLVRVVDIVEDETGREELDEITGRRQRVIIEDREKKLHPHIEVVQKKGDKEKRLRDFVIPEGAQLTVEDGQEVYAGLVLAKVAREAYKTRDITGGLPRVAELFEARRPKDPATISEVDGVVRFGEIKRGKREVWVHAEEAEPH